MSTKIESETHPSSIPSTVRDPRHGLWLTLSRRAMAAENATVFAFDAARLVAASLGGATFAIAHWSDETNGWRYDDKCQSARFQTTASQPASGEAERSLAGYAASGTHPVRVEDLHEESRFVDAALRAQGVRSAIACPLSAQPLFGVFCILGVEPEQFSQADEEFVESVAHLVTLVYLRNDQQEKSVCPQQPNAQAIWRQAPLVVATLDRDQKILDTNPFLEKLTGLANEKVRGSGFAGTFVATSSAETVQLAIDRALETEHVTHSEGHVLASQNERRRIQWRFVPLAGAPAVGEAAVLAFGIDVSERDYAEQRLASAQAKAAQANQALGELVSVFDDNSPYLPEEEPTEGELTEGESPSAQRRARRERRRKSRRPYPYMQRVAPYREGRRPPPDGFRKYRCYNISANGFSFLAHDEVDFDHCVVAFGAEPNFTYLTGEIMHSTEVERDGETVYLLGCRYTGRVIYDN